MTLLTKERRTGREGEKSYVRGRRASPEKKGIPVLIRVPRPFAPGLNGTDFENKFNS